MKKFYSFQWAQKRGEILVEALKEYDEKALMHGNLVLETPFWVKVSEGKKLYDIAHLQDPFNFAVSERVYNLLKEAGLTGWSSYEIAIEGRSEKYYGFQVTGKCGKLDVPKEEGFYTGYKFDYDTWDGSDFFSPEDTLLIFCTERVKTFFKVNEVTNTELTDISVVKAYSVGTI
ncbi:hypothetical protein LVD17_03050 [Fulvivirga ulvae]|uniref:hypothetical protein n=1 Tax=Fulvivirga ulvae TaxID=2904245 RepID=UPI001F415AA5|nr:hypothetical protein [Fulvivirga ulvae]UII32809.1 hypothetical protein LVD17_03050 [Fulvivirga ulvae]